ncbi:HTH_Tnp_Tc3_2 domain-containing protein [Trichonephila clavipes]|nr:HTH_Tnp_Tc3_2 domain-containing protein [Trichonephila clavipes]
MQRDCALRKTGRGRLTSFSVEYKKGRPRQTSCREDRPIVRNTRVQPTASSEDIQAQVAPSLEAPVSFRTIRRRLAEGHLGSWRPLRVLPLTPTHRRGAAHEETGLQWNGTRSSLATNPDSISAVMTNVFVCGDPVENASILPLLYSGTLIPQLERYGKGVTSSVNTLTWPARSPDLSPIEHIWDYLGWQVGHPTNLSELEERLLQIWNETSQDNIQNMYASMPDRIASCIRARVDSTGY